MIDSLSEMYEAEDRTCVGLLGKLSKRFNRSKTRDSRGYLTTQNFEMG